MPLIYLLTAFIIGIISGRYFSAPYYPLLAIIPLVLLFIFVTIRKRQPVAGIFLILCFISLIGYFNIQKHQYFFEQSQNISQYIDKGQITIEGIIIEAPLTYSDKNILVLKCLRTIKNGKYIPVSGNIRLAIPPDLKFQYGDFIRLYSTLKKIHNFNNPGGFDYESSLKLQGIQATGFISDNSKIIVLRHNIANNVKLKLESFRNYLKYIICNNASSPQKEIIEAMTIGNQNEIPEDIWNKFNKTGTAHILSISGLHIGMVSAFSFFFAFLFLKSSEYLMLRFNIIKLAAFVSFLMVMIYAFIAGMGVTVMRSSIMALIFLTALIAGKQKDLYSTLALAGLIILAISPEALFDISFQLSFMAVLALIYIVPKFSNFNSENISSLPLWIRSIFRYTYLSVIVCVVSTIGTLPLIMYYFNRVSFVTIIANLITVPLLGTLTLGILMLFIISAFFSEATAGFFVKLASPLVQISVDIIDKLADMPWSSFNTVKPNLTEILLFYLLIFIVTELINEKRKKKEQKVSSSNRLRFIKYSLILLLIFFIVDITYLVVKNKLSTNLKVTVIDVGQGNSILVQFPGGRNMLIDGGGFSESYFDVGKFIITPFLYHERISHIDTVVLTHPHPDHLLGLIYILNNFHTRQIWKSFLPVNKNEFPEWEKTIKLNNPQIIQLSDKSPEKIINGVRIKILWPHLHSEEKTKNLAFDEINDTSLVLKIAFGKTNILIPGDISRDVEKRLIETGKNLRSNVLIMPHHGSNHSNSIEFIKAVSCNFAIASAGKSNVFHHPHPLTIKRYISSGARIYRTDRDGAITLTTDGNNLQIETFVKSK